MKSKVENYADIDIFCEINEGFSSFHKKNNYFGWKLI